MKIKSALILSFAAGVLCAAAPADSLTCASPDGKNTLAFTLGEKGEPVYSFVYRGKTVVEPSTLGFDVKVLAKDAFDGRRPRRSGTGSQSLAWSARLRTRRGGRCGARRARYATATRRCSSSSCRRAPDAAWTCAFACSTTEWDSATNSPRMTTTPSRGSFRARTSRPRERLSRSPTSRSSRSARASTFRATPRRGGFRRTTRRRSTATRSRASARYRASSRPRRTRTFRPRSPTSRRCRPR